MSVSVAAVLVLSACGSRNGALKRITVPKSKMTIELPGNWRFRDATYPSDHATLFWYDPHDAFAKVEMVISGCVGCVSYPEKNDYTTPDPRAEVPQFATVQRSADPYIAPFHLFDAPYEDDGTVIVLHRGSTIAGSVVLQVWLPAKKQAEATQILASFTPALS